MGSRKGFIHIIELIMVSLTILLLLNQFSVIQPQRGGWEREKLSLLGNDLLFSLDRAGINWFSSGAVSSAMENALKGRNIRYSVSVRNALPPSISAGCICTPSEYSLITSYLSPFIINNRTVNMTLFRLENITFPVTHDVIVIGQSAFHSASISSTKADMEAYLGTGRGMVALSTVPVSLNSVHREIFGLRQFPAATGRVRFSAADSPDARRLARLFVSLPPQSINRTFESALLINGNLTATSGEGFVSILKAESGDASALITGMKGSGKTVWLPAGLQEEGTLLKSSLLFALRETFEIIKADLKRPLTFSLFKAIGAKDYTPGMFEAYEVILKLEYAF